MSFDFLVPLGTAFKWTNMEDQIKVDEIADFNIKVTRTKKDFISKRKDIPKELQITSASNNLDITLVSKGEQVGHGDQFPKGLAYYRQSLLVSSKKSKGNGYGMLELIIENN